jgi:hypothetical protein
MSTYKLTFTVTIEDQDDPAARKHAQGIIEALGELVSGAKVKLQQVHQEEAPTPCVSIVVASNKQREETARHANEIFPRLSHPDDPEDDRPRQAQRGLYL